MTIKAPFPWFGGKSRVADVVWRRFGAVSHYIEPFAGSLAVLLGRPSWHRDRRVCAETVNDKDAYLCNFWRAVKHDPDLVAIHAADPVNETDLFARHHWLVNSGAERIAALEADPEFYDAKVAGWWVWGQCSWIGSGWCNDGGRGPHHPGGIGNAGRGVNRQRPHIGDNGVGVNRQLPHIGDRGTGITETNRLSAITEYMRTLADRLSTVRVACGDWTRILGGPVRAWGHGTVGVFLDPPYDEGRDNADLYCGGDGVSRDVFQWCRDHGDLTYGGHPIRIAVCEYEGAWDPPDGWTEYAWSTGGGYGNQSNSEGRRNKDRERIWFNAACLPVDSGLFSAR